MNIKPIGVVIVILLLAAACSQSPVNETAIPTSTSAAAKVRSTVSFAPKPILTKDQPHPFGHRRNAGAAPGTGYGP